MATDTITKDADGWTAIPHPLGTDGGGRDLYCNPGNGWTVEAADGYNLEFDADGNYVVVQTEGR